MMATRHSPVGRANRLAAVLLNLLLYGCYFVHLRADFPNGSPWNDWAKFTDEGWYGGAALHHALTGQWYVPNGFNPAVGLPGWPLLLAGWFSFTGAGMAAARVLTVLLLGGSVLLMCLLLRPICGSLAALGAAALILANPFVFSFHRLAILEPLIVFLMMLALWCATAAAKVRPASGTANHRSRARALLGSITVGALLAGMVLTKTTALVLAPAVLYQMWATAALHRWHRTALSTSALSASAGKRASSLRFGLHLLWRDRGALWPPAFAAATAVLLWSAWYLLWVRPRYLPGYRQLFFINNGHAHGRILLQVMAHAWGDSLWINTILVSVALLVLAASFRFLGELWRIPLFGASVLAFAGTVGFIGWHTWFQPRYYLVCVLPIVMLIALGLHALASRTHTAAPRGWWRLTHAAALLAVWIAGATMLVQTAGDLLHPQYTLLSTAQSIARIMRDDPAHSPVLLSSSGDNISLLTGIRAVNPEWPLGGLAALTQQQRPGWYAAYTPWDDKHIPEVAALYHMHAVAHYHVFDDPDHQALILYRLDSRR